MEDTIKTNKNSLDNSREIIDIYTIKFLGIMLKKKKMQDPYKKY